MPDILSHFDPQDNGFGKITKIHKSIRIFNRNFVEKANKACYDYGTNDPPAECLRRLELSAYGDRSIEKETSKTHLHKCDPPFYRGDFWFLDKEELPWNT